MNISVRTLAANKRILNWRLISSEQRLSEPTIRRFKKYVDWPSICAYQKLSEPFIREFREKIDWYLISRYQVLSEEFIREFKDKVDWEGISHCQILTNEFRTEIRLSPQYPEPSRNEKIKAMKSYAKKWNLKFDGEYLFAYRNHDQLGRGAFNSTLSYAPGNYYQDWHCDYNVNNLYSFGLGIWPEGNTPVKVSVDDFGIVVTYYDGKCRVKGFHVLHQNEMEK